MKWENQFNSFWELYPRKVGKLAARKQFEKALREDSFENIINGLKEYKKHLPDDPKFIPHPKTFLSQGRWMDEENKPIEIDESEKAYNHLWMQNHLKRNGDPDLQEKDCPHPGNREEFKKKWAEGWRP